jgi:uncharacterized protein (TIGR00251 family)
MSSRELIRVLGDDAVEIAVHAHPGAGRTQVVGRHGDALKIRVAAPPERGRANEALAAVLADTFGVPVKQVQLVGGEASRSKRFRLDGVEPDAVAKRLDDLVGPSKGREF